MLISTSSLKIFLLIILCILQSNTANPLPPNNPVTPTILGILPSNLDQMTNISTVIGSARAESLEVLPHPVAGTTTFLLHFLNRSAPANMTTYTLANVTGIWRHVVSTQMSLSCSMVKNLMGKYDLLQFDSNQGMLKLLGLSDSIATILAGRSLNMSNLNMSHSNLSSDIFWGEKCEKGVIFGSMYLVKNGSLTMVNMSNQANKVAISPSFNYFIAFPNILYMFRPSSNDYTNIGTLGNYAHYKIMEYMNRVIVIAQNITPNVNTIQFDMIQKIYLIQNSTIIQADLTNIVGMDQNMTMVKGSPYLSNLGFKYSINMTSHVKMININYQNMNISTVTFDNPTDEQEFLDMLVDAQENELIIGEYFIYLRNGENNNTVTPKETLYQLVGTSIFKIRGRMLPPNNTIDWKWGFIDQNYRNQFVFLAFHIVNNNDLEINQFRFGSAAQNLQPIFQEDYFFNFTPPSGFHPNPHAFLDKYLMWTYEATMPGGNGTNMTEFTEITFNESMPHNMEMNNFTIGGVNMLIAQSKHCKLIKNIDLSIYTLLEMNRNTHEYEQVDDITAEVSSMLGNNTWRLSDRCEIFTIDNSVFVRTTAMNGSISYNNVNNNIVWKDLSWNLTLGISGNDIHMFNPAINDYSLIYTENTAFLNDANIYTSPGKVIVVSSQISGNNFMLKINAYAMVMQNLTKVFEWQKNDYLPIHANPTVSISQNLTTIFIAGQNMNMTNIVSNFSGFFLNYTAATKMRFDLPIALYNNASNIEIKVSDKFLYYYQRHYLSEVNVEAVVFFAHNSVPVVVYKRPISAAENNKSSVRYIRINMRGNLEILSKTNEGGQIIIRQREVSPSLNSDSDSSNGAGQIISNGAVSLCPPGCQSCTSNTVCSRCNDGFSLSTSTNTCSLCGQRCISCNSDDPNTCTACRRGAYLVGSLCMPCNSNCTACNTTQICTSCPPTLFFDGSSCQNCQKFCLECSSANTCTMCFKGFVLTSANPPKCRRCSTSCSSCDPLNVTSCTSCDSGLELLNGVCMPCPLNCLSCLMGVCTTCKKTFSVSSNGSCIKACLLPCLSCSEIHPSHCMSCFAGNILNGQTCTIDLTCNQYNNCTGCGIGYWKVISKCYPCSKISNCVNCDPTNGQVCATCAQGFYTNNSACAACPTQCSLCVDANICLACIDGFYLPSGQSESQCLACEPPCLTCLGSNNLCTSCVTNFTFEKFRCRNKIFIGYKITLNVDPSTILQNIDMFYSGILNLMGEPTNLNAVTISSVSIGSAVVAGEVSPSNADSTADTSQTLNSNLIAGFSFGNGINILDASYETYGLSPDTTPTPPTETNLAIIIGFSVGVPLLVIASIIIGVCIYKKKQLAQINEEHEKRSTAEFIGNQSHLEGKIVPANNIITIEDERNISTNQFEKVADYHQ